MNGWTVTVKVKKEESGGNNKNGLLGYGKDLIYVYVVPSG